MLLQLKKGGRGRSRCGLYILLTSFPYCSSTFYVHIKFFRKWGHTTWFAFSLNSRSRPHLFQVFFFFVSARHSCSSCTIIYFTIPVLINIWVALHVSTVRTVALLNILASKFLGLELLFSGNVYKIETTKLSKKAKQISTGLNRFVNLVESGISSFQIFYFLMFLAMGSHCFA